MRAFMAQPRVSVIIPLYNQAKYVCEAIKSVLNQSYGNYEIIVVDDGSTDNGREVVTAFGNQVRYLWQENQGLGGARNTGICHAQGEFIGLLDSDDSWLPNFLEMMVQLADQSPKAAVYYCSAQGMDGKGNELPEIFGRSVYPSDSLYHQLLRADFLIPSTILMRRAVVIDAGLFEQKNRTIHGCEDWDLWLRIAPEHEFIGTKACLVRYRLHSQSMSTNPSVMQQAVRAVIEKHFGPDDEQWQSWSIEKKRAYGGVYRNHIITSVQRQNDWRSAEVYMYKALQVDPTLCTDLDLFYDLAHGNQLAGYRDTAYQLNLEENAAHINQMLKNIFNSFKATELGGTSRRTLGSANYALGLIAYNTGKRSLSRHYFVSALYYRPELWRDRRLIGISIKSLFRPSTIERMKRYRNQAKI
jgi:glycosyltransferase involved in cell wall biosynthesis